MLSLPEQRNILVQKLVPTLIRNLTGFNDKDKNFNICLDFSWSLIKHHRFLSVNSHEIKREMEGIFEKFRFNNFHEEEKRFRKMYEELISHEICTEHYEKDVIFSILSLLTNLADSPLHIIKVKLRENRQIFLEPLEAPALDKELLEMKSQLLVALLEDNIITRQDDDDCDLSDWSDNESDVIQVVQTIKDPVEPVQIIVQPHSIFKEPVKEIIYKQFESLDPEGWLKSHVQNTWWEDKENSCEVISHHPGASFCEEWQNHLTNKSLGFIKTTPKSTISEYCIIREILWMFSNPFDCKCFKIIKNEIILSQNPPVTIPSITVNSLQIFLQDFLKRINIMNNLQQDCKRYQQSSSISHTYESYIGEIQKYLDHVIEFVVAEEEIVKNQNETYTLIRLHHKFTSNFELLDMLWDIHSDSLLDSNNYPSHICSSYLIASLHGHIIYNGFKKKKNLAIVLFLKALKPYLMILHSWWTENYRLEDFKDEFLVKNVLDCDSNEIVQRFLVKNKEKSFYLSTVISNRIVKDSIIQMLLFYSLKAGYTLNIIARLDMIDEMRTMNNRALNITLYDDFMKIILNEIKGFAVKQETKEQLDEVITIKQEDKKTISMDILENILDDGDDFLMLAFQSTFDLINEESEQLDDKTAIVNPLELYEKLNEASDWLLPLENSISKTIEHLLRQKLSIAERFVMRIYRDEFQVEKHLQDLRNVFFLESNELMHFFYTTLFRDIETGESVWSNPYLLTMSMNQVLSSRNSTISSTLFSVEIGKTKRNIFSVMDAIDGLSIHYNVGNNLSNVITPNYIRQYNKVFKFLLKMKYGLWIMNELRFPDFFKKRPPYAKLQLIDIVIKRLALARFWIQYCINSCHNHFMMNLQSLSKELDARVKKAENISEFIDCHEAFINTSYKYTLLTSENSDIYELIIQMLKLAGVLKNEWANVIKDYELDEQGKIENSSSLQEMNTSANKIENSYIQFHAKLKTLLNNDQKSYLSALNDALNSIPYS
ncbi:unnamed protein product [Diamesa serratosioi]